MELERRSYSHLDPPFGAFCQAVRTGEWLFVSGLTARGTSAEYGDIVEQTEAILKGLQTVLEIEGGTLSDIIRVTVYTTELDRLTEVHEVRFRYFGDDLPASTLVQVAALIRPHLKIEIEAICRLH